MRKKNASSPVSPVSRYVLYAIGEIFLVVIGILIAVQIDNWNEQRKIAEREKIYLTRLKEEAIWNMKILDQQIDLYLSQSKKLDSIANLVSAGEPVSKDLCLIAAPYFISAWQLRSSTYSELVSSGTLGILSDIELREMLDEAASFEIITIQTLNYWRDMSLQDIGLYQKYRKVANPKDDVLNSSSIMLDYNEMTVDKVAISGLYFWSNANNKFAGGINEFKSTHVKILDRINCLENNNCQDKNDLITN